MYKHLGRSTGYGVPGLVEAGSERENEVARQLWRNARRASWEVTPSDPSELPCCPKVAEQLPTSCSGSRETCRSWSKFGRCWPKLANILLNSTNLGRCWYMFGRSGLNLAEILASFGPSWPVSFGRCFAGSGQIVAKLRPCFGQVQHHFGQIRPSWAEVGQMFAKFGPGRLGDCSATFGQGRSSLGSRRG